MDATTAWELFIAGFTDSGHARCHATRFRTGPLEAVRFAAGELSGTPFEEFFVRDCDPAAALAAIAAHQRLSRHYLTVLADRPGLRETYERGGYRLDDTETLMACDLATLAPLTYSPGVTLLREEEADWAQAAAPVAQAAPAP